MYIKKFNESKPEDNELIPNSEPTKDNTLSIDEIAKKYARSRALPGNQLYKSAFHHAKCFLEWQQKQNNL